MALETKPWDTAEFLRDEEDLAGYLAVVLEEHGTAKLFAHALKVACRARGGVAAVAAETGIAEDELTSAIAHEDDRSMSTLVRVQQAYERRVATRLVA